MAGKASNVLFAIAEKDADGNFGGAMLAFGSAGRLDLAGGALGREK